MFVFPVPQTAHANRFSHGGGGTLPSASTPISAQTQSDSLPSHTPHRLAIGLEKHGQFKTSIAASRRRAPETPGDGRLSSELVQNLKWRYFRFAAIVRSKIKLTYIASRLHKSTDVSNVYIHAWKSDPITLNL